MKKDNITSIMNDLAESAVPSAEIDLWPTIRGHLVESKTFSQKRRPSIKPYLLKNKNFRIAAITTFILLLFVMIILATPSGRAWAQQILQFFTRTENETLPMPTAASITLYGVTPGVPVPTPTPQATPATLFAECGDAVAPLCSFEEIRGKVTFPVKQLGNIPYGFSFTGAYGAPDFITLVYDRPEYQGRLFLVVQPWQAAAKQKGEIPPSASVEVVKIGSLNGEYVKGAWFSDSSTVTWDPKQSQQILIWRESDVVYTLNLLGRYSGESIDKQTLVDLAQTLTVGPLQGTEIGEGSVSATPRQTNDLQEASSLAGFELKTPAWLPAAFSFHTVSLGDGQKTACLHFRNKDDTMIDSLNLAEGPDLQLPSADRLSAPGNPYTLSQVVAIGGSEKGQGLFVEGNVPAVDLCGLPNLSVRRALLWKSNGMSFILYADMTSPTQPYTSQVQMIRLAESITGVQTVTEETIDPQNLHSVAEAEQVAGFDLKEPSMLPAGEEFSSGQFFYTGRQKIVTLTYTNIWITQIQGGSDSLESIIGKDLDTYEKVSVHGQPAYYRQGCRDETGWNKECFGTYMLVWLEDGIEYHLEGIVQWGLKPDTVIEIAESLR